MSGFQGKQSFPYEKHPNGDLKLLPVLGFETHLLPGAVMLALRCADSEQALLAGGNQTVQLALSLRQVKDLQEVLKNAESVLRQAESGAAGQH